MARWRNGLKISCMRIRRFKFKISIFLYKKSAKGMRNRGLKVFNNSSERRWRNLS